MILVNRAGKIVWQYGKAGATGSGFNRLNTPVVMLDIDAGGNYVIDPTWAAAEHFPIPTVATPATTVPAS